MENKIEQEFSQSKGLFMLWAGWVIGPLAWIIHLSASYLLVAWVCVTGNYLVLYLLSAVMLLVAAGGIFLNWHCWRKFGAEWPSSAGGVPPRSRFMSLVGLLVNVLFFVIIVAQTIPMLVLGACA